MINVETFNEYQFVANSMGISLDKFLEEHPDLPQDVIDLLALSYNGLGLGEVGEVQGKIKKIIRDNGGIITEQAKHAIALELGDTMWYIADMCRNIGIPMGTVASMNIEKLKNRHINGTVSGSGDYR